MHTLTYMACSHIHTFELYIGDEEEGEGEEQARVNKDKLCFFTFFGCVVKSNGYTLYSHIFSSMPQPAAGGSISTS